MSEIPLSIPLPLRMRPDVAQHRIEVFCKRFGDAHLYLAYHAAFPLILTPDLLYRLRANFPRDIHNEDLSIPWIAVADLLLSSLCDEVGYELYNMDLTVRTELLNQLRDHPRFGPQRISDLSNFLLKYVQQQLDSYNPTIRKFAQAQEWTALAATKPEEAIHNIALTLSRLNPGDRAEFGRIASLIETFAVSSDEFNLLLEYIRGMEYYARGETSGAVVQFNKMAKGGEFLHIEGISLFIPKQIHEKIELRPVKVFVLGLPGSGKSTISRYMVDYAKKQHRSWSTSRLNDYVILHEMFRADTKHQKFRPTEHDGFDVLDLSQFDIALKEMERRAKKAIQASEKADLILIEFARNDYRRAFA